MKLGKNIFLLEFAILITLPTLSCSASDNGASMEHPVSLLDYVIDLGTITNYDESKVMKYCKEQYFENQKFGCSCVVTQVDGKNIVGRNFDITITENSCFKFVLDINKYKALGLFYSYRFSQLNYQNIIKNGLDDFSKMIIPFFADDYLNEKGLYIQVNMRQEEDGYGVTSTNPDSDVDLYLMSFPAYAITRCANVNEAVELATNGVNLYNNIDPNKTITWNFAFTLADAQGNYGVLEVANNKVSYLPKQNGQTNYYITPEFAKNAKYQCGESRFETINKNLDKVKNIDDMLNHMEKVYYSMSNRWDNIENCPYDVRSEKVHAYPVNDEGFIELAYPNTNNCTYEWLMDDSRKDYVFEMIKKINKLYYGNFMNEDNTWNYAALRQAFADIPDFWITMFSIGVDCTSKKMKVRFFESRNKQLEFSI